MPLSWSAWARARAASRWVGEEPEDAPQLWREVRIEGLHIFETYKTQTTGLLPLLVLLMLVRLAMAVTGVEFSLKRFRGESDVIGSPC